MVVIKLIKKYIFCWHLHSRNCACAVRLIPRIWNFKYEKIAFCKNCKILCRKMIPYKCGDTLWEITDGIYIIIIEKILYYTFIHMTWALIAICRSGQKFRLKWVVCACHMTIYYYINKCCGRMPFICICNYVSVVWKIKSSMNKFIANY